MKVRPALVRLHRWAGLALAGFVSLVGLTGAAIAWNDAGERLFAPSMFVLPKASAAGPALDPFVLREAAERAAPGFAVNAVDFTRRSDEPARFALEARPGGASPNNDEIALNPATGAMIGARRHGDIGQGVINLMPFLYDLHDALALGDGGVFILGLVALAWTIDCFVGLWLTLPMPARSPRAPLTWGRRWGRAWRIRLPAHGFKLTFDLHAAGGLWLWSVLGLLAWSGVAFNLPGVYQPVMGAVLGWDAEPKLRIPTASALAPPQLDWRAAHAIGVRAMTMEADRLGFRIRGERLMFYDPTRRTYAYRVRSTLDPGELGETQLTLDADSGRVLEFNRPTGGSSGKSFTTWIENLHTAKVFSLPMRIVLTAAGLGTGLLSVTGVLIWLRKRKSRC